MTTYAFFIVLILVAIIITLLGVLTIRVAVQMYEHLYWHKASFKEEAKKRYQRKSNTNGTKRISKSPRKV